MIQLPHDCYCSDLSVHPNNWQTRRASLKKKWYIQYRFYDPTIKSGPYKNGRLIIIKGRLNQVDSLEDRQAMVAKYLLREKSLLQQGYNAIFRKIIKPVQEFEYEIDPETRFPEALDAALQKLTGVKGTKEDAKSVLRYVSTAAIKLGYHSLPVNQIKKRHIKVLLDFMQNSDSKFSDQKYNRYRANLYMLFAVLTDLDVLEYNPCERVKRKKVIKKIRPTLLPEEREKVNDHLHTFYRDFHRFVHIFFHSGVRITELLAVKGVDVDLHNQRYKVTIKKGTAKREEYKIIKDIALPYWTEAMANCSNEDYVFSTELIPGKEMLASNRISRIWKKWVKDDLGITADFYSLKHSNTTETVEALDEMNAAKMNSHTTTAMVVNIYDVKQKQRKDEKLKKVNNPFV